MKSRKFYIILIFSFIILIPIFVIYNNSFGKKEIVNLKDSYFYPKNNRTIEYEIELEIYKPSYKISDNHPLVMLLHGDFVDTNLFNIIRNEFLLNNYIVVMFKMEFTTTMYFKLNTTLNYLLERQDVNINQIGIYGHSHGSHFALHFGRMRSDVIKSVICANFGPVVQMYNDYYDYFVNYIDKAGNYNYQEYMDNYSFNIKEDSPKNLFMINDKDSYLRAREDHPLIIWPMNSKNMMIGDIKNYTARKILIQSSFFFHASGMIDPFFLNEEIDWMNISVRNIYENNSFYQIVLRVFLYLTLIFVIIIISIIFIFNIIRILPYQEIKLNLLLKESKFLSLNDGSQEKNEIKFKNNYQKEIIKNQDFLFYSKIISFYFLGFLFLFNVIRYVFFNENYVFYMPPNIEFFVTKFFEFNQALVFEIFENVISFKYMTFWIILLVFFNSTSLENYEGNDLEFKHKRKLTIKNFYIIPIIGFEIYFIFYFFFNFIFYYILEVLPSFSILSLLFRLLILYYINQYGLEIYEANNVKHEFEPNKNKLKLILYFLFAYAPMLIPSSYYIFYYENFYLFFIIPYGILILLNFYLIIRNTDILKITLFNFYGLVIFRFLINTFVLIPY